MSSLTATPKSITTMVTNEPDIAATARLGICDAARLLGVHRTTLARWTEQGLVKCGIRRTNGRIFYTGRALVSLWRSQA